MDFIKYFSDISTNDIAEVGGKGASLGEMINAGIPVPNGYVVTTETFKKFFGQELTVEVRGKILKAFDELGVKRVAVRSSAVAEDSASASWAGQLESYLNVTKENLIEAIRDCWNSIRSERALAYASSQNVNEEDLIVAVVVQKMVNSEVAGVMFTVNPITNKTQELMIEGGFGLGEMVVQGMITPDNFLVDKKSLEIKSKDINEQDMMLVFKDGGNVEIDVSKNKKSKQVLSDEQIKELAKIGLKIEKHYGFAVDIEWAMEDGKFYIVQSRPITTL